MTANDQTRDFLNVIADAPCTVTYAGVEVIGTRGGITSTERLQEGGFLEEPDLQFVTTLKKLEAGSLVDRFTTVPTKGEKLTIDGIVYRIERIIKDEYGVCIQFDLMTPHK